MKKYIVYLAATLAFVGCQNDIEELDIMTPLQHSLTVSLPSDDDSTRVEFTDGESSISLSWEHGDTFTIYNSSGSKVDDYEYYARDDNNSAIFTAVNGVNLLTDGSSYTAVSPAVEGVTTLSDHRTALAARVLEQTQVGNNSIDHLNDALRMEATFTYNSTSNTEVNFSHTLATMRITFALEEDAIPAKFEFSDGDYATYSINMDDTTEAASYTAYYVINPNEGGERTLNFLITTTNGDMQFFSVISSVTYSVGNCYVADVPGLTVYTKIYTAEDMYNVRNDLSGSYILMADIDLSDYSSWTPIGSSDSSFSGILDGGGHTITGLKIDSSSDCQGLFGYVSGGSISNLIIEDAQVSGGSFVGAVCGYLYSGTIEKCGVMGGSVEGGSDVGGVVGWAYSSTTITSCYNTGSVSGSSAVGGVVGAAWHSSSSVTSCYNTGSVEGSDGSVGGVVGSAYDSSVTSCYCIAGANYLYGTSVLTLSDLNDAVSDMNSTAGGEYFTVNSGNILPSLFDEQITYEDVTDYVEHLDIGSVADLKAFRDIVANNNAWQPRTVALTADIDLNSEEWTPIGSYNAPFSGTFDGGGHTISNLSINSSDNNQGLFGYVKGGSISNLIIEDAQVSGGSSVGAVCGRLYSGTIEKCEVVGGYVVGSGDCVGGVVGAAWHSSSITSCYNTGSVERSSLVGGVVGYAYKSSVTSCYNTGSVSGDDWSVGGVVGNIDGSSVTSCYNTGSVEGSGNSVGGVVGYAFSSSSVTSCYNTGSVEGSSSVGGVVGYAYASSSSITSCYNTGFVEGSGSYVGGVVGYAYSSSSVTSCYFIDRAEDDAEYGVGNSTSSSYDYMKLSSVSALNAVVSTMNSAAGGTPYTAGSPSTTNLPYLFDENLLYE